MNSVIEAIIFDIDGTLVILPIDWGKITSEIKRISNNNVNTFLGFIAKYYNTKEFWYIHRMLEEEELKAVENMRILDNAHSYIANLCNSMKIGFVTMQSRKAAEKILGRLGLTKCINTLVSREDASTRTVQLSIALNNLNVKPRNTLFIGDKVGDAIAAIINNVNAIIVIRNPIDMRISETDYLDEDLEVFGVSIVRSLSEAIEVAKRFFNI